MLERQSSRLNEDTEQVRFAVMAQRSRQWWTRLVLHQQWTHCPGEFIARWKLTSHLYHATHMVA